MAYLALILVTAMLLAEAFISRTNQAPRHRAGSTVAEIQARLCAETRTYLPLRGW